MGHGYVVFFWHGGHVHELHAMKRRLWNPLKTLPIICMSEFCLGTKKASSNLPLKSQLHVPYMEHIRVFRRFFGSILFFYPDPWRDDPI